MSYNLFLDDFRRPEDAFNYMHLPIYNLEDWVIVRDYSEFVSVIEERGIPDIISFDHDLADVHYKQQDFDYSQNDCEKTGYHCAKWFIDYCLDNNEKLPKRIIIHSMNPYGSRNIESLFKSYIKVHGTGLPDIPENNPVIDINPRLGY